MYPKRRKRFSRSPRLATASTAATVSARRAGPAAFSCAERQRVRSHELISVRGASEHLRDAATRLDGCVCGELRQVPNLGGGSQNVVRQHRPAALHERKRVRVRLLGHQRGDGGAQGARRVGRRRGRVRGEVRGSSRRVRPVGGQVQAARARVLVQLGEERRCGQRLVAEFRDERVGRAHQPSPALLGRHGGDARTAGGGLCGRRGGCGSGGGRLGLSEWRQHGGG